MWHHIQTWLPLSFLVHENSSSMDRVGYCSWNTALPIQTTCRYWSWEWLGQFKQRSGQRWFRALPTAHQQIVSLVSHMFLCCLGLFLQVFYSQPGVIVVSMVDINFLIFDCSCGRYSGYKLLFRRWLVINVNTHVTCEAKYCSKCNLYHKHSLCSPAVNHK